MKNSQNNEFKSQGKRESSPILPHSKEAERAILGAILMGTANADKVLQNLEPDDFFLPFHKVIFRHLKRLHSLDMPTCDSVLLHDSLDESKELEAAGGVAFIASLLDLVPRVSNTDRYVEIIKTKALARSTIFFFQAGIEKILNANGNLPDILQEISFHSAPTYEKYGRKTSDPFKTARTIAEECAVTQFVVEPYLAAGAVTDLVAKIKAGKTTYALGEFVRKTLTKGPVVYLTEQPFASFKVALARACLLEAENLFVLPFSAVIGMEWTAIARVATKKCKEAGAMLLVVDTVSHFAGLEGDSENNSGAALACMKPLQEAAASGIAVLTIRHERKSGGEIGDAGRGSSAFGGAADTLLSLRRLEGRTRTNLRKIECISRFDGLPEEAIFEYGNGRYEYRGTQNEISEREAEAVILEAAPEMEEQAKELAALIEGAEVARSTAQRVIKKLLNGGDLTRIGKGRKKDPFRYFLTKKVSAQTPHTGGQNEIHSKPGHVDKPSGGFAR